jgi:protein-disulfide isomerase/uncharacterized membrane protein
MRKIVLFWATIALTTAALAASAILLVDYLRHAPVFCDIDGGCQRVKASPFAHPFGIPMPAFGIVGLLGLGLSALVPGSRARFVQAAFAIGAAALAIQLLFVQRSIGSFCPFCVVVDTSAILLGIVSIIRLVARWDPPPGRLRPGLAASAMLLGIGAPIAIGAALKPKPPIAGLPPAIAGEIRLSGSKVTVVDFVDFECPFCRMTHAELAPLLDERRSVVRVVRKLVPLRIHAHALDAAKAGCCSEKMGKGDELADALFRAPPEELTAEGCEKLAAGLGLDTELFRACVNDPATQARIDADRETFHAVQGHGLPTIWIDGTRLDGAQDREQLAATLDAAIRARSL